MDYLAELFWIGIFVLSAAYTAFKRRQSSSRPPAQSSTSRPAGTFESVGGSIRRMADAHRPHRPPVEPPRQIGRSVTRTTRPARPDPRSLEEVAWTKPNRGEPVVARPVAPRPAWSARLSTRSGVRQAILMQEILGPPKGLRDDRGGGADRPIDGR